MPADSDMVMVPREVVGALIDLIPLHDKFMRAQGGCSGNQEDAYNLVAARWDEWAKARAAAESVALALMAAPSTTSTAEQVGEYITFNPSGDHGNAVISPEEPADGVYWTLIGSGPNLDQNALAAEIVRRLNAPSPGEGDAPVAWRFKLAGDDEWELCFLNPRCDTSDFDAVEPLFTRPTPATPEGLRSDAAEISMAAAHLSDLLRADHLTGDYPIAGMGSVSWNDLRAILAALQPQAQGGE